jgi:hypothetical protein
MPAILFGCLLGFLGIVFYGLQRQQRHKLRTSQLARMATVQDLQVMAQAVAAEMGGGDWRDYVKLWGEVFAETPLSSEIQKEPCVYYQTRAIQEYETITYHRDEKTGKRTQETQRSSETLVNHTRSMPFWLKDNTGQIEVDVTGAQIETVEVLNQFEPLQAGITSIKKGPFTFEVPSQTAGRRILGYRYQESILPVGRRILVLGTVSDQGGKLLIQQSNQAEQSFVVSLRSDEVYAAEAANSARTFNRLAIGCWIGGILLVIIGLVT